MFGKKQSILFFSLIAILILWQLFLPGYVLTLDMIFVPKISSILTNTEYLNALPLKYFMFVLNTFLPGWLIQKIILFGLFFSLGYLSFLFLPLPKNTTVRVFGALLYTLNPFVYTRFLAGQWTVLFAFACLPLLVHFVKNFGEKANHKNTIGLWGTFFLISIFSLHIFVMAVLALVAWFVIWTVQNSHHRQQLFASLQLLMLGGLGFVIVASYWLIPRFLGDSSGFEKRFEQNHWYAFSAAGHGDISTELNAAVLFGFWGEKEPWSEQFVWPQEYAFFWVVFASLIILMFFGIWKIASDTQYRKHRIWLVFTLCGGTLVYIWSTGVENSVFAPFNLWFFHHIPFWRGFRDTQKFTVIIALIYTVLSSYGVWFLLEKYNNKNLQKNAQLFLLLPLLLGFFLLGGFRHQLKSVWYPQEWTAVKKIVQNAPEGKQTLFLPWHGYVSFHFNDNILIANPAHSYFGKTSIVSKSIEMEGLYDQESSDTYRRLDEVITGKTRLSTPQIVQFLRESNIQYVVHFTDLQENDPWKYIFLQSQEVKRVFSSGTVVVYEVLEIIHK